MRTHEPVPGTSINSCACEMIALADKFKEPVFATFNNIGLVANPGDDAGELVGTFHFKQGMRAARYRDSPEGRAAARRAEEARKRAEAAESEGIRPFAVSDQAKWASWVENNREPYGAATVRYASRWAHLMDAAIAKGFRLEEVAEATSREADAEGITGFMYGFAVSMLAQCWAHGEDLRRWHNLKTQIGNEGQKANESGGVLNPALMTIGGSSAESRSD